jgi:hypothetical protein
VLADRFIRQFSDGEQHIGRRGLAQVGRCLKLESGCMDDA